MSVYIDKKYINMLSPNLEQFSWKKDNLATCRCPICGDSKKNANKRRGYFYLKKGNFFFKCYNCNYGCNVYNFMEKIAPHYCKEYSLEKFQDNPISGRKRRPVTTPKAIVPQAKKKVIEHIDGLESVLSLSKDHPCIQYIENRKIPKSKWNRLYYTDDFSVIAKKIDPNTSKLLKEARLVLPIIATDGSLVGVQGRKIDDGYSPKYITIKAEGYSDRLWFGLKDVDTNKKCFVVEGPIDSLFLSNAVAMIGLDAIDAMPEKLLKCKEVVFVFDNEPRNPDVVRVYEKTLEMGLNVCIWPDKIKDKDINDMSKTIEPKIIENIITQNTYHGPAGLLALAKWSRCKTRNRNYGK